MKKILFIISIFVTTCSSTAKSQQPIPLITVKSNTVTYLYGTKASRTEGKVAKQNGDFLKFTGPARIEWTIKVNTAGTYEVNLCIGVKSAGEENHLSIASGSSSVSYLLMPTQGVWGTGSFERILLKNTLQLKAGNQQMTLTIPETVKGNPVMDFRCLELIPVAAKLSIEADQKEALRSRANSDWLVKAGYGLMFHWTSQSVNKDGTQKSYTEAVDDFDLKAFVKMVKSTGAGYVLFTIGHAKPYCPAPLKSWEKYHPAHTTKRDLIAEMADALNTESIKFMCYFPTHVVAKYKKVTEKEFSEINNEVITEFGQRYGNKVAGYWFDGWYQCFEEYPNVSFPDFFKVCKVGNPERIIALNSWIYPAVTEWQEFWAGETASPVELPKNGTLERGPGKGLRYQSLLIMEPYWVQEKAEIPDPRFTVDELSKYIEDCMEQAGAVTINIGIYQDGTIGKKAFEVMQGVKKRIRK
jgi:hypothetical protein